MKRMDEVFELPLQTIFTGQGFHVKTNPTDSPELETDCPVNAWAAAHAINHIDALADALELITTDYTQYTQIYGVDLTDDHSAKLNEMMAAAIAALAAYRGDK